MIPKVKIGIVGTGRMGSYHLAKFSQMPEVDLVGIYEPNPERALEVANKNHVKTFSSLEELIFLVDGLVIASPTPTHFGVAKAAIELGCHVLVEKPFCETYEETMVLVELARQKEVVCQVGFLERFRLEALLGPYFPTSNLRLESQRLSAVLGREPSVDVVSDLMVHDIDLILSLTREEPTRVTAEGFSVVTDYLDFAKAQLEFPNGVIANLTASRVAPKVVRTLQLVTRDSFCELDFVTNTKFMNAKHGANKIVSGPIEIDALQSQSYNFIQSIQRRAFPKAGAQDGARVIAITNRIKEAILSGGSSFTLFKNPESTLVLNEH
jgi:predicted dehydrogenase